MSNKRTHGRSGQRVSTARPRVARVTRSMDAAREAIAAAREAKQQQLAAARFWASVLARAERDRRLGRGDYKRRRRRKPRTSQKPWIPRHDLDT